MSDEQIEETDSRASRTSESRENEKNEQTWAPAPLLPNAPTEDGWDFAWKRTMLAGVFDDRNISQALREGWVPVRREDYPELNSVILSDLRSRFEDNFEIGGLLMMKRPSEIGDAARADQAKRAAAELEASIGNLLEMSDPRMPILKPERKTRITFGGGSR